jgi:RNA polymerase sigma-70 factor (ECF subfamily)
MSELTLRLRNELAQQLDFLRRFLIQRRRSSKKDVDDLIQEAFVRMCRYQQQQQEPVRDPVAFLMDCVEKVRIERFRRAAITDRIFSDEPIEEIECADSAATPEQDAEAQQLIERIDRCLATAHAHTREAFLLHRFGGLSYTEIAERLRISTATVQRHIARAMLLFKGELQNE